jgi:hypothetical protein
VPGPPHRGPLNEKIFKVGCIHRFDLIFKTAPGHESVDWVGSFDDRKPDMGDLMAQNPYILVCSRHPLIPMDFAVFM